MPDTSIPSGLNRRELWIDARDLQSEKDDGTAMTEGEYTAILTTRGAEKMAEHQLVRSFDATVRTVNPTYEYGVDFFLGDTITVIDDRLGISVDAVVHGVSHGVTRNGETMSLIFGYQQPTIFEKLQRKAGK